MRGACSVGLDVLNPHHHLGDSQNYGPFLATSYITAPDIYGYQNGTLILGTTHLVLGPFRMEAHYL